jgi:hypothetical protein
MADTRLVNVIEEDGTKYVVRVNEDGSVKKVRRFLVELPPEINVMLEKIVVPFYRTTNTSHALRLMIEDVAKGLEGNGSRIALDSRKLKIDGE